MQGECPQKRIDRLLEWIAPAYTFDPMDAEKNHWHFSQQFYFPVQLRHLEEKPSAFFIGRDKGRFALLRDLQNVFLRNGCQCDFWIVRDETSKGNHESLHDDGMPYTEVLKRIEKASILLDFVKPGQTGVTVRFCEGIFYDKKIITNNPAVYSLSVYDKSRIFVVDFKRPLSEIAEELQVFIHNPMKKYSKKEKNLFSFETWMEHFR